MVLCEESDWVSGSPWGCGMGASLAMFGEKRWTTELCIVTYGAIESWSN